MTRGDAINKLAITNLMLEDVADIIDDIYTDFESKTCESCKHFEIKTKRDVVTSGFCSNDNCSFCCCYVKLDDGCNQHEAKL